MPTENGCQKRQEVLKGSGSLMANGSKGSKEQSRYKKGATDNSVEDQEVWWRMVKRNKAEDSHKWDRIFKSDHDTKFKNF